MKFIAILELLLGFVLAQNPGLRVAITSKGLAYIYTVGLPILEQQIANVNIPDVTGSYRVSVLGKFDYELSNIKIADFRIPSSDLKSGTAGLTVEASGISLSASAHWHYWKDSWLHVSDSGSADLSVRSVSLSVSVTVEKDTQGHPTIKTTGCLLRVGHLSIKFHGGASWLYNLFDDQIAGSLKNNLQGQLCSAATKSINDQGNKALESLTLTVKVGGTSEVNYALLSKPIFNANYVEMQNKGEFQSIANPVDIPFSPPSLPAITAYDKMMYLWLTDYLANSAGVVYQKAGVLQYTITPDMVPDNLPIHLNTGLFNFILPALYEAFPNMDMEIYINATKPPVLQITPDAASFTLYGNVSVNVIQANEAKVNAFVLGLVIDTDVQVWVHSTGAKQVISGNCTLLRFVTTVLSSNIGDFSTELLQDSLSLLLKAFVIPILNQQGNSGLMIPTIDGLTFVNPQITFGQGYILIDTDVTYEPISKRA